MLEILFGKTKMLKNQCKMQEQQKHIIFYSQDECPPSHDNKQATLRGHGFTEAKR
jgi:hypothetical protein